MLQLRLPGAHSPCSVFPCFQTNEPGEEGARMPAITNVIEVRTSPHMHVDRSVEMIMRNVVYALLPLCVYAVWLFGISALALIVTATSACVLTEHVGCRMTGKSSSLGDFSVLITGILLGLTLPPGL